MGKLYYKTGLAKTRYNNLMEQYGKSYNPYSQVGSIQQNYDYAQIMVSLTNNNFDYDKAKPDGSDIVFYYKDNNGSYQLATFYCYFWQQYYDGSLFILKIPNVKYNKNVDLIIEYGKDYEPPSGQERQTGRTSNIENVVEMFDDFNSFDSNKWKNNGSYSISDSKIRINNPTTFNHLRTPSLYTKNKYNNIGYTFWFRGKFTYSEESDRFHPYPWSPETYYDLEYLSATGMYYDIDESKANELDGYKGRFYGRGRYIYYDHRTQTIGGVTYNYEKPLLPIWYREQYQQQRVGDPYMWLGYAFSEVGGNEPFAGGQTSNGQDGIYSYSLVPYRDESMRQLDIACTHKVNLITDEGYFVSERPISIKERKASWGFTGTDRAITEIEWAMVMTNQYFWAGLTWSSELEPTLVIEKPVGNICSLIPEIKVVAYDWFDTTGMEVDVTIYTDQDEKCIEFLDKSMIGETNPTWNYKMVESDDFLARGNFKITAIAINQFNYSLSTEEEFLIENCYSDYRFKELNRDFTKFQGTVKFEIKNETEERINIKNFLQNINKNNSLVPINITESDTSFNGNYLLGLKTTLPDNREYEFTFDFEQDEIYDALNKKDIYVDSRIVLFNYDGAEWDVSQFVKEYSFDKDADLGSVELNVTMDLSAKLSPFYAVGEPYSFYGNKIEVYQKLKKVDGTIYEVKKYTGWISEASSSKIAIHITAHDKFQKFNNKTNEDIYIFPEKTYVDEYLTTFDGAKFQSSNSSWAEYPPSRIFLGSKQLTQGEYAIDYPRGIVYIFRNTLVSGDVKQVILNVNDFEDRKTFSLGFDIDYSSSPQVEHTCFEKINDYSCVGGIAGDSVWIERYDLLDIDDYYIDYENNKLILYVALPEDDDTEKDHRLTISAREILRVSAKYYYQHEETNEVEDIIYNLATRVGFEEEELTDTVTERIYKGDENIVYTLKNNIKTINGMVINGNTVQEEDWENSEDNRKDGKIEFKTTTGINIIETPLDAIVSLQHVSITGGSLSLDISDYYYADASIKGSGMNTNDYIEIDYDRKYFYKSCGKYGMIGIWVKTNKTSNIGFSVYDRIQGEKFQTAFISVNTWTPIIINANGTSLDEIYKIEIRVYEDDIDLNVDYFYLVEDNIQIDYTYYTLQNTGITISETWFLKEEIDTYMDIIDELIGQVEPSYLIYIDKDGKLRGEYTKVASYVLKGQVIKRVFVDVEDYAGYFYLPEFSMNMVRTAETSISNEELYNAVIVLGKLADKNNVALFTDADDMCSWANGTAYGLSKTSSITNFIKYVSPDVPALLIKKLQQGAPDTWEGLALTDSDVWSGLNWYLESRNSSDGNVTVNSYMVKVTLREPVLFDEIALCVGAYKGNKISVAMYIEVEDEEGFKWYPEGEFPNKQQGETGDWLTWKSDYNKNKKIKYIHIYCNSPHHWVDSESIENSKK